jgi:hypothetical protein
MRSSRARRAVVLSSILVLTGLAAPVVTSAHAPECGRLIGSGLTMGYGPNNFAPIAANVVDYALDNSNFASQPFALFETHDPWDDTVVETAIDAEAELTQFTPGDLTNFGFSGYQVVVLNWDDTEVQDFNTPYGGVVNNLEDYIEHGGVVWLQTAFQSFGGPTSIDLPFGGTGDYSESSSEVIVEPTHALMSGITSPIPGDGSAHVAFHNLPGGAHVITRQGSAGGPPSMYTLRACVDGTYQADGRIRKGSGTYAGNNTYNDDGTGQSRTGSAGAGTNITFSISIQNDGQFSDRFDVQAVPVITVLGGVAPYTVTYWKGTTDITTKVVNGTYRTKTLDPGGSTVIKAKVKFKAAATVGLEVRRLVTIYSVAEPRRLDAVEFTGKRS